MDKIILRTTNLNNLFQKPILENIHIIDGTDRHRNN